MNTLAIIGAQWGDEGKGKITDVLCEKADVVVRYQGGNNAGHTIVVGEKKIVLHQIPSGILHDHTVSVIAHGTVFEPEACLKEIEELSEELTITPERLIISEHASVITKYHMLLDGAREASSTKQIGTTKKGIGPAYEDKISRKGLHVRDLFDKKGLVEKLEHLMKEKSVLFSTLYNTEVPTIEDEAKRLYSLGEKIAPFVQDSFSYIAKANKENKRIIFEGAQGILLDIDFGTYPYVTSSSTGYGGIFTGAGLPSGSVDERLGIVKAYTTRVGEGPFPTELFNDIGEHIQQKGHEFGATTGRKRRCGWIDLPLLSYAVQAAALTSVALTKVDVLAGLDSLDICYAYDYEGKEYTTAFPGMDLANVTPKYKKVSGFHDDFSSTTLSEELSAYINIIEDAIGVSVGIVAHGPERSEIIWKKDYL